MLANELSLFAMVVESKSFSKAATLADMSTSALSKRITKLEADIGVQLLYRTTRRITLTEAGEKLYFHAKDINKQVSEALGEVSAYSTRLSGHIRISVPTISGELFLAQSLAEFSQQYPDLTLEVRLENEFVDLLKEGVDLAIRTGVLDDSTLIAKPLITSHWAVCCSAKYIQNFGKPTVPAQLTEHNCLAYTHQNQGGDEWRFGEGENLQQIKISGGFATNNAQALRKAALGGHGIVYIPRCSVYEDLQKGDLIEVLAEFKPRSLGVYAVYPFTKHLPYKVKLLIEHVKQGYEKLSHYF